MAQGFTAITTSLGEAERQKNGKKWTDADFAEHKKHYNIDKNLTHLNSVIVSAHGMSEPELVNHEMLSKMFALNQQKRNKVEQWNREHSELNPHDQHRRMMSLKPDGKRYRQKSVDKREIFPVGDDTDGKRVMPYDTFHTAIERGNARGKEADSTRLRTGVLQQFAVSFGNSDEWSSDPVRRHFANQIKKGNPKSKRNFEANYIKPYLDKFQAENPSMKVVQAVVHYDETNPHLQFTVLPHVDGKQSGGLGSVSYTGAIRHDHPEYGKSKTIDQWYQHQHDLIREIIRTQKPLTNNKTHESAGMVLGDRPGSHKSHRVDQFAVMSREQDKQRAYLADQQARLTEETRKEAERKVKLDQRDAIQNQREADLKTVTLNQIQILDENHKVPQERLEELSEPIKTDRGREQHRRQPLEWLTEVARELTARLHRQFEHVKQLGTMLKKREAEVKASEQGVEQRRFANSIQFLKRVAGLPKEVEQRYTKLNSEKRLGNIRFKNGKTVTPEVLFDLGIERFDKQYHKALKREQTMDVRDENGDEFVLTDQYGYAKPTEMGTERKTLLERRNAGIVEYGQKEKEAISEPEVLEDDGLDF